MKNKVSSKINISSMQVIKTLQVLLQGNYTMNELVDRLNFKEKDAIFNNSVVSKYINTCRYCGIDIPKIQNKYFVASMPFGLDLTSNDIDLLEKLQNVVKENIIKKYCKFFDDFIERINKYSNKQIIKVDKSTYKMSLELFENAMCERRKVKFLYKNGSEYICTPLKLVENGDRVFFNVLYKNREKLINSDRVSGLSILSEKFFPRMSDVTVTYKMKRELAKRYVLRENEKILQKFENGDIVISNNGEVKDILFSRLFRYDDLCEILTPKNYREEFKTILESTLSNYGEL